MRFKFTVDKDGVSYKQDRSFGLWRLHCAVCGKDERCGFTYRDTQEIGAAMGWLVGPPYSDDLCPDCRPKAKVNQEAEQELVV